MIAWGLSGDPPFDAVCRELARTSTPHAVVDQRVGSRADFADATALFARPYSAVALHDQLLGGTSDARRAAQVTQFEQFARIELADMLVVNRPSATATNSSKPHQAELIRAHGFAVPETLVTTTPDDARQFIARHGSAIYKSVSDVRSAVTRVDDASTPPLDDVVNAPTQFQAYVRGTDWRVHVVGDAIFACEIRCEADDYRCAPLENVPLEIRVGRLPTPIAEQCHSLAHGLRLPLAGIDLRRTDAGEWYCFEVNPAPAFTYYEQETGQPLTQAVVALLASAASATGKLAA